MDFNWEKQTKGKKKKTKKYQLNWFCAKLKKS